MRRGLFILGVAMVLLAGIALAAQLINSYKSFRMVANHGEHQLFRCDFGDSLAGGGAVGGELCATNDWSQAVDARWADRMTLYAFDYSAAGSLDVSLWDCIDPTVVGAVGSVAKPGVEDPAGTPSVSDPDPLCVDITAGAGVTIAGTAAGIQKFSLSERKFNYLVARLDDCTDCNAIVHLTLARNSK